MEWVVLVVREEVSPRNGEEEEEEEEVVEEEVVEEEEEEEEEVNVCKVEVKGREPVREKDKIG